MKREDLKELYYITHIDNLLSILKDGILCYEKAKKKQHRSIANSEVQDRRDKVVIPDSKKLLHSYVNLYFNARNSMMYFLVKNYNHEELVVIQTDLSILDEYGVIISDRNAASDYTRFYPVTDGISGLNKDIIFAKYWTSSNLFIQSMRIKIKHECGSAVS